jgi:hypothetical protein
METLQEKLNKNQYFFLKKGKLKFVKFYTENENENRSCLYFSKTGYATFKSYNEAISFKWKIIRIIFDNIEDSEKRNKAVDQMEKLTVEKIFI